MAVAGRCVTKALGVVTFNGGRMALLVRRGKISLANSSTGDSLEL